MRTNRARCVLIILFVVLVAGVAGLAVYLYYGRTPAVRQAADLLPGFDEARLEPFLKVGFGRLSNLEDWTIHHFNGKAHAEIKEDEIGEWLIEIRSRGDATLFLKEARVAMGNRPHVSWEWKVGQFPSGKQNKEFAVKTESDFGARLYVVFSGLTPFTSETIQYIWDNHFPEGTYRSIPLFSHLKMMVIRRTDAPERQWRREIRDVYGDYEMLFGKPPTKPIRAIGMMVDSDNTGTEAQAQFRNIWIHIPSALATQAAADAAKRGRFDSVLGERSFLKKVQEMAGSLRAAGRRAFSRLGFQAAGGVK